MSDLLQKINTATNELAAMQKQYGDLEKEANDHEVAARECRRKRGDLKSQIATLNTTLNHATAAQAVETEHQAAQKARAAAEAVQKESAATLEALKAERAELQALLAKAKEPTKVEEPVKE